MITEIVENSYYDHQEHGEVKVLEAGDASVAFEIRNKWIRLPGGDKVPLCKYERPSEFMKMASPSNIDVTADSIQIKTVSMTSGGEN